MFVILLKYIKPIDIVDKHLEAHRAFLTKCYAQDLLIASGPQIPRTGGVILSQIQDRGQLDEIISQDPFNINKIAEYTIIEFDPVKYHANFSSFVTL
jgi:uncharacterized protein YciI